MTDLSTANHSRNSAESGPSACNFESALRLAAEFFAQQHHLQQQQQQQQQIQQQQLNSPIFPYLRCRQQQQSSGHLQSTPLSQQTSLQQNRLSANENGLSTLTPSQLALLQTSNEHPTAAAAFHAHLLLQSQVSLERQSKKDFIFIKYPILTINYISKPFKLPAELLAAKPPAREHSSKSCSSLNTV